MPRKKPELSPVKTCESVSPDGLSQVLARQADLTYLVSGRHAAASADESLHTDSNEEAWKRFHRREFHDTRRVTLEKFHLFEWFPLAPGKFHTNEGRRNREEAGRMHTLTIKGDTCYNPSGKLKMLLGGVGCVRLRPRNVGDRREEHYFWTASATGVCHEGFPVLVPRKLAGRVLGRLAREGAVPVTLSGEMRFVGESASPLFQDHRELPQLYLHVDKLQPHRSPQQAVTNYAVSVAASFEGTVEGQQGKYVTYDTFDPADPDGVGKAAEWIESVYVSQTYAGRIITDFDEVVTQFSRAPFGLPNLLAGQTDVARTVTEILGHGYSPTPEFLANYRQRLVDTRGGSFIQIIVEKVEAGGVVGGTVALPGVTGRPGQP